MDKEVSTRTAPSKRLKALNGSDLFRTGLSAGVVSRSGHKSAASNAAIFDLGRERTRFRCKVVRTQRIFTSFNTHSRCHRSRRGSLLHLRPADGRRRRLLGRQRVRPAGDGRHGGPPDPYGSDGARFRWALGRGGGRELGSGRGFHKGNVIWTVA